MKRLLQQAQTKFNSSHLVTLGIILLAAVISSPASAERLWIGDGGSFILAADAPVVGTERIRFNVDSAAVDSAVFDFNVAGATLRARRVHSERFPGGGSWSGWVDDYESQLLEVTWSDNRLAGRLETSDGLWEVRPLTAGESLLVPIDINSFPNELPPLHPDVHLLPKAAATHADQPGDLAPAASNEWRMDVLVTYLSGVLTEAGSAANLSASVRNFIYGANEAARKSGFQGRFHLVGLVENRLPDNDDSNALLRALTSDSWTATQRDHYGADLVSLLVPVAGHSGLCGLGWIMGDHDTYAYESYAFQLSRFDCSKTNYTWAHEHGHNLGFTHDAANVSSTPYHPYALGWGVDGVFRTIMAYASACNPSCPRIGIFSTPLKSHAGHPAGVTDVADNTRVGNITAPIVAAYRIGDVVFADDFES